MKFLFLDIDGVLNSGASTLYNTRRYAHLERRERAKKLDPMACSNLYYLLDKFPDCKIVISSYWRKVYSPSEMTDILNSNGVQGDRVVGATPYEGVTPSQGFHVNRADEILDYCKRNNIDPKDTCAIDDNPIGGNYPGYFFLTESYNGLTCTDICKILNYYDHEIPIMLF